ncbi:U32 family peptidase [Clostridium sp. D2Q-11]|uniref:U32 family peptidase n=1 Tax=Anaeromonas frigoriresistens TaxID=2683708 RepID=A0A942Z6V1_9FIRM|nr:U32 family peptidase [Anaeromonas frigoriresistens]MBS4537982.1 U32 family peptidase [Anaeromonas frigoriresistens]
MDNVELLAPVGSKESLYLAIINGADAVYLGGKAFNARQYASNFDNDELISAVKIAHIMGVKVYVTLNILLKENELEDVMDYILFLYNIDVDALIIQDLGLTRIIKRVLPDFEIHASTQMTINNTEGVKFAEELGFERVVLSREVSVDDIRKIKRNTNIELEGFVHGALCISYSGQCLLSSIIGGRSGNRGRCAQPCRMNYSLLNIRNSKIINGTQEKHLLSPKDLNTIENLDEIIHAGITSLKIEGRMKRPEYVATIVSKYRKKLDYILGKTEKDINKIDIREIEQIFNREFTKGFILKEESKDIINIDKSNNSGIKAGKVIKTKKDIIYIKLEEDLRVNDGIEIRDNSKDIGFKIDVLYNKNENKVDMVKKGNVAIVKVKNNPINDGIVYKTADSKLLEESMEPIKRGFQGNISINMAIELKLHTLPKLYLWDNEGNHIEVRGINNVEKGEKISLTKDKVIEQMSKLGNTLYLLNSIEINMDEGIMVRLGELNKLRREAIRALDSKKEVMNNRVVLDSLDKTILLNNKKNSTKQKKLAIKVKSYDQFERLDLDRVDRIYLDFYKDLNKALEKLNKILVEKYISLDRIIEDVEFVEIKEKIMKIEKNIDGISVSNLGSLNFVKNNFATKIHCDIGINIYNSQGLELLMEKGVESATLSPELTNNEIKEIYRKSGMEVEVNAYGYLPVMFTKYCPSTPVSNCTGNSCEVCGTSDLALVDRKNMKFRFHRSKNLTTIYNSQPIFVLDKLDKINSIDIIRLDFTFDDELIEEVQKKYYDNINNKLDLGDIKILKENLNERNGYTRGHLFRGVL